MEKKTAPRRRKPRTSKASAGRGPRALVGLNIPHPAGAGELRLEAGEPIPADMPAEILAELLALDPPVILES
jgi:hypothetical protein